MYFCCFKVDHMFEWPIFYLCRCNSVDGTGVSVQFWELLCVAASCLHQRHGSQCAVRSTIQMLPPARGERMPHPSRRRVCVRRCCRDAFPHLCWCREACGICERSLVLHPPGACRQCLGEAQGRVCPTSSEISYNTQRHASGERPATLSQAMLADLRSPRQKRSMAS